MKIALFGKGKMGKMVEQMAHLQGYSVVEPRLATVCIDFSHADVVLEHVEWAARNQKPIVIGTTGWESRLHAAQEIIEKREGTALYSPNFSLGMAYFIQLVAQARSFFDTYDVAGIEFHHRQKKDAPSGTAKEIAHRIGLKNPFSSVRCGTIAGKHEVIFDSPSDTITLTHDAHNREGFAKGALQAAQWIQDKKGWLTLDDMLRSLHSAHYSV